METVALIKGMFINSHIDRLRELKGTEGVYELNIRLGKFDGFNTLDDYPVSLEVKVIEHVLDLISEQPIPTHLRAFEAGRLHFRNFSNTSYGSMIMSLAPRTKEGFAMLLLHAPAIARFVFRNTNFASERLESGAIKISMENNDYPIDHFRGFFYEWAIYSGFSKASVTAAESAPRKFEYTISFIEAA